MLKSSNQEERDKVNEMKRTNQSVLLISSSSFKLVTSRLLSPAREGGEREDLATPASFTSDDGVGSRWLMTRHIGYIRTYIRTVARTRSYTSIVPIYTYIHTIHHTLHILIHIHRINE